MSGNNSVVECNLAKVEVASSNLVSRSIFSLSPLWPRPISQKTNYYPIENIVILSY